MNLPNTVTGARVLLIPVVVLLMADPTPIRSVFSATIFLLASITDLLDGYLARRRSQITIIGKLLDPVADKLLILSGLIVLVSVGRVSAWIAIVIIGRDLAVTGLRALASSQGMVIAADSWGKIKMSLQIIAVTLLLLPREPYAALHPLGIALLGASILFAVFSAGRYFLWFSRSMGVRATK